MNRVLPAALLVGILLGATPTNAERQEAGFPNTKRLGRATVEFRDAQLQVVLNYEYSQRNHDSAWLLVDFGARSERRLEIERPVHVFERLRLRAMGDRRRVSR